MARVKLNQIEIGKQLAEDSYSSNGRLLLKSGSIIEEKHLEIFRTWGVIEVEIASDEPDEGALNSDFSTLPAKIQKQIELDLEQQFKHCNVQHPLIRELVAYQKVQKIEKYLLHKGDSE